MTRRECIRNERIPPPNRWRTFEPERDVIARIHWSFSGVERIRTEARWWAGQDVFVLIRDGRWKHDGAWLHVNDVEPDDQPQ